MEVTALAGRLCKRHVVMVCAALAGLILMQQMLQLPGRSALQLALHNAAHTPFFFVLTLLAWRLEAVFFRFGILRKLLILLVVMTLLGVLTEVLQIFTRRDASFEDWLRNMLGIGGAVALIASFKVGLKLPRGARTGLRLVCVSLLLAGFQSVFEVLENELSKIAMAPHLLPMDASALRQMSRIRADWEIVPGSGVGEGAQGALELTFGRAAYPGLTLREPRSDWRKYNWLILDVQALGEDGYPLTVRVETYSDRGMDHTVDVVASKDRTEHRIPLQQLLAGSPEHRDRVRNLLVFTGASGQGKKMLIHDIRLE